MPQVTLSVYRTQVHPKQVSQLLQMQLFCSASAGNVPQVPPVELESALGTCKMEICFCKRSRGSVLNHGSVKQIYFST